MPKRALAQRVAIAATRMASPRQHEHAHHIVVVGGAEGVSVSAPAIPSSDKRPGHDLVVGTLDSIRSVGRASR